MYTVPRPDGTYEWMYFPFGAAASFCVENCIPGTKLTLKRKFENFTRVKGLYRFGIINLQDNTTNPCKKLRGAGHIHEALERIRHSQACISLHS